MSGRVKSRVSPWHCPVSCKHGHFCKRLRVVDRNQGNFKFLCHATHWRYFRLFRNNNGVIIWHKYVHSLVRGVNKSIFGEVQIYFHCHTGPKLMQWRWSANVTASGVTSSDSLSDQIVPRAIPFRYSSKIMTMSTTTSWESVTCQALNTGHTLPHFSSQQPSGRRSIFSFTEQKSES